MKKSFPKFSLLRAVVKRNKPFVFDSALLPSSKLEQENTIRQFDLAHICRYHQVTGWDTSKTQTLHPCYLHLFSFKQHMRLMLDDDFPFALLGTVHVNNSIEQKRPISTSDVGVLRSEFGEFKRHNKGITAQIVSQYRVSDEVVWSSCSEFLMIDKRLKRPKIGTLGQANPDEDVDWSDTANIHVNNALIRQYARVSGDFNPIHLHNWSARLFGFNTAIAHGMWSKARALSALQKDCLASFQCKVSFNRPLSLPANVRLLTQQEREGQIKFKLDAKNRASNHLSGTIYKT